MVSGCFSVNYACAFTCARSFTLLSARGVFVVHVFFSVSPPSSPYHFSFSTELLFSVVGAGTGAGFWLMGCSTDPGLGWRYQPSGP